VEIWRDEINCGFDESEVLWHLELAAKDCDVQGVICGVVGLEGISDEIYGVDDMSRWGSSQGEKLG
jgi:hypothetical protein